MPEDKGSSYSQGASAARSGINAARRAGRTTRDIVRGVSRAKNWKVKAIAIIAVLLLLLLTAVLVGGTNSTSMDATHFLTAEDAEKINVPETMDELESVYTKVRSLETTSKLAAIIEQERMKSRQSTEDIVRKNYSSYSDITIECDTDDSPVFICDDIDGYGTPYVEGGPGAGSSITGTGAERIAQTAEMYAWPEGTAKKKYCLEASSKAKGYNGYEAMFHRHMGYPTWSGAHNDHLKRGACCCHSANAIASEAIGLADGKRLPSLMLPNKDKIKKLKNYGFEVFNYSGNEADLVRGDIVTFATSSYHHVAIYLGNGLVCDGGLTHGNFPRIRKGPHKKSGTSVYKVIRYTGDGGASAQTATTGPQASYTELTTLQTLSKSTGTWKAIDAPKGYATQSFAYNGGTYYLLHITSGKTGGGGYVYSYDSSMNNLGRSPSKQVLRHGNGAAYCTKDNLIYSVTTRYVGNNVKAVKVDPATLKTVGTVNLKHGSSAIAYDRVTNRFITSSGAKNGKASGTGYLYIYEPDLKTPAGIKTIKKMRWATPGDIAAYNGIIYVNISAGDQNFGNNHVDMYSEETGEYLGSYDCPYGEIEGVDIDDAGQLVLSFRDEGGQFIQFTGINTSGSAGARGGIVSQSDLEILSAYSISLANTELRFAEQNSTEEKDGVTLSHRYTDLNGKPVKLYWFGNDKGKINYEGDLKAKVKDWNFYHTKTEIIEKGKSIKITLSEKAAHELCEDFFELDPKAVYVNSLAEPGSIAEGSGVSDDEGMLLDDGITTNAEAIYSLSSNTAHTLYTGQVSRGDITGGIGLFPGGTMNFPLPDGKWTKTSDFGHRPSPGAGASDNHPGIDLGAKEGTPIYAACDGLVTIAGSYSGYGNAVVVKKGNMEVVYGHMSQVLVPNNTSVVTGQKIGLVGNTGISYGAHLHFEIRINGTPVDPAPYLGLN